MIIPLDWPLALAVLVSGFTHGNANVYYDPPWERLNQPVAELGITLEIWDRAEMDRFTDNVVTYLPQYYQQMRDCPSLAELDRFLCGPEDARRCLELNVAYQQYLKFNRCMVWPHRWREFQPSLIEEVLVECSRLSCIWEYVKEATSIRSAFTVRREALRGLRAKIGEEAWAAGWLPPPVPLELFTEFD